MCRKILSLYKQYTWKSVFNSISGCQLGDWSYSFKVQISDILRKVFLNRFKTSKGSENKTKLKILNYKMVNLKLIKSFEQKSLILSFI